MHFRVVDRFAAIILKGAERVVPLVVPFELHMSDLVVHVAGAPHVPGHILGAFGTSMPQELKLHLSHLNRKGLRFSFQLKDMATGTWTSWDLI